MVNIQNKVIHRFIRPIAEYEEGGLYYSNIIPLDTQAYAYYSEVNENHDAGLYFVFGDGQHTYTEIRDGKGITEGAREYAVKSEGISKEQLEAELENLTQKFDDELEQALDKVVKWSYYPEDPERKAIVLNNHDSLTGTMTDGDGANLVMLSKWDVADFGSVKVHANLNTKDNVTINDKEIVATQSFVEETLDNKADKKELESLDNRVETIEDTLDDLDEHFEDMVEWSHYPDDNNRKAIVLANHDSLTGTKVDGEGANLVMLSKWDVADFGSSKIHLNLNTNEKVTINDSKTVATVEDIEEAVKDIVIDESKFETKENAAVTASELTDRLDKISENLEDMMTILKSLQESVNKLSKAIVIIDE